MHNVPVLEIEKKYASINYTVPNIYPYCVAIMRLASGVVLQEKLRKFMDLLAISQLTSISYQKEKQPPIMVIYLGWDGVGRE